nr:reverse transcriptase domain-containing protein [Tanacetum cinerariifolium]
MQQEKLKAVKARLNFEKASQYSESGTPSRRRSLKERLGSRHVHSMSRSPGPRRGHSESPRKRDPERKTVFKKLEKGVFHRLRDKGKSTSAYSNDSRRQSYHSSRRNTERVLAQEKQSLLPKNIITKDHPHEGRKRCQKAKKKCIKDPVEIHNIKKSSCGDEMMKVTTAFLRGEVAASNRKRKKSFSSWKQQEARQKQNFKKRGFRNQHRPERKHDIFTLLTKTPKEILALDKGKFKRPPPMTTPVEKRNASKFWEEDGTEGLIIIEAEMGGHFVHHIYVDEGSSSKIMYEHCFNRFRPEIGDEEHSTSVWMNFMVVRSPSPYNGIIRRPGVRRIQAVPSTAHGMLKFPVTGRTVTLRSKEGRKELCAQLRRNLDIFAWKPADMTGFTRPIAEHGLNIREGCPPVRQKKRGQAPERNKAIYEEVEKLVDVGIMKEIHYHGWLSNLVMVKKHDGSWRMCVDFKDLNKAFPKDGYPLPEIDWKVESFCGYPFKCFLDAYKGYHQIKMEKEDEEKTTFTSQGIFCYSEMSFGLKNVGATYQRRVDKAFQKQIGQNLEVYVDDLVIKSRTKQEIIRDMEETFKTLREINMKLNPKKYTFGMREGMFLGYKVNADGLRMLSSHEVAGRLLKWRFELEGHDIHYRPRTSVKGHILADFIVERPKDDLPDTPMKDKEELPDPWILFTYRSSYIDGFGAGLIITNPEGVEFTYALIFRFHATNNEAEYEALIVGLRIAEQIGVKNLQANVDSKLVANQVNGTYVEKEPGMIKYLEKVNVKPT